MLAVMMLAMSLFACGVDNKRAATEAPTAADANVKSTVAATSAAAAAETTASGNIVEIPAEDEYELPILN